MNKNYALIFSAIIIVAVLATGYLFWFTSPNYVVQTVTVIANTADGCIAETMNGFSVNIGPCDAEPNDVISAKYDTNVLKREAAMNP
jgi:capsular polysaccharide biosynthesis protein